MLCIAGWVETSNIALADFVSCVRFAILDIKMAVARRVASPKLDEEMIPQRNSFEGWSWTASVALTDVSGSDDCARVEMGCTVTHSATPTHKAIDIRISETIHTFVIHSAGNYRPAE